MRKSLFVLYLLAILAVSACGSAPTESNTIPQVAFDQNFALSQAPGKDSAQLPNGVTVKLVEVLDSRCPEGVDCVWAGYVEVSLLLMNGQKAETQLKLALEALPDMHLQESGVWQGVRLALKSVLPKPVYGKQLEGKDIRVTLIASQTAAAEPQKTTASAASTLPSAAAGSTPPAGSDIDPTLPACGIDDRSQFCPTQIPCPKQVLVCPSRDPYSSANPPAWSAGFKEPDTTHYVDVLPIVQEYLYLRKQAVLTGSVDVLWQRFPGLKQGVDKPKGINAEETMLYGYRLLKPIDGNINAEYYERLKLKDMDTTPQVLLHGMELYTFKDENGHFSQSGGEFVIALYLERQNGKWTVIKTDEVTPEEFKR